MITWILCLHLWTLNGAPLQIASAKDPTRIVISAEMGEGQLKSEPRLDQRNGEQILRLVLLRESGDVGPPILGQYSGKGKRLTFIPRYALTHGQKYKAIFKQGVETIEQEYLVPAKVPTTPAVVDHIYPSANKLPANLLKFYVHFSKPMREGKKIFDQIEILDAAGKPVPSPWRRMELWSDDARRLTLWIHPGRVKRGLKLRDELGPVLKSGGKYSLSISADVIDADGQSLGGSFVKEFDVIEADRQRPLPSTWRLDLPLANSKTALKLNFSEALDRHLCRRLIKVLDSENQPVPGKATMGEGELSWKFVPNANWARAAYEVAIDPILEDLAGNTPARLFDVDIQEPKPKPPTLKLQFELK